MKENLTHICCITDRSGSMHSIADDVIGGFNKLVEEQCAQPGGCTLTYCQFDTEYEIVYADVAIDKVPPLTSETFVPRGGTALLDAVGRTIVTTGERLAAMDEAERPAKVLCIIITDGQENSSHEYKLDRIREMILHQTEKYKWEFIYLGADDKAFDEARGMGLKLGNVAKFAGTKMGARAAYGAATRAVSNYRAGADVDNLVVNSVDKGDANLEVQDSASGTRDSDQN